MADDKTKVPLGGKIYEWIHDKKPQQKPTPPVIGGANPANAQALKEAGEEPRRGAKAGYAQGGTVGVDGMSPPPVSDTEIAAVTPGEEIVPQDVAQYLGKKFFMDLVARTRAEMAQSGATSAPPPNVFTDMANEDEVKPQGLGRGGY